MRTTLDSLVQDYGVIVHLDSELGALFTWNTGHTFKVWVQREDGYECVDTFKRNMEAKIDVAMRTCIGYCEHQRTIHRSI
jgi:hypothetical protein